ncbi:MAG: hypothetical protein NVSMB19_14180 [Vulcanimicrobiaceae bacterium]
MVRAYFVAFSILGCLALAPAATQHRPGADAAGPNPAQGWTIHVDAKKHFGAAHPDEIAHHWCKSVASGITECQLYDSDEPNARLVGVETIVSPAAHAAFESAERPLWHYHKDEIPKVSATTPDMTPEEAKKFVADLGDTYGKVWLLWDPQTTPQPVGTPWVSIVN